jgi:hypothetical protein
MSWHHFLIFAAGLAFGIYPGMIIMGLLVKASQTSREEEALSWQIAAKAEQLKNWCDPAIPFSPKTTADEKYHATP